MLNENIFQLKDWVGRELDRLELAGVDCSIEQALILSSISG